MKQAGNVLIGASGVAVILAIIGAFGTDIWLASTQWLLVAGVLTMWAIYVKVCC